MTPPTIKLGAHAVTLGKPGAVAALALCRSEEDRATDGHEVGVCLGAAAMAICWPRDTAWPVLARPMPWRAGVAIERYGQDVCDALAETYHVLDLLPHFAAAYEWAVSSRITRGEVETAQDFSGAPAGA